MSRNLTVLMLIALVNNLSNTILIPIIFRYAQTFGLNEFQISLIFISLPLVQFFANPVLGGLSDRFGRKSVLMVSLAGSVVASLMAAMAPNVWIFALARVISGLTAGGSTAVAASLSDISTPETRPQYFGLFNAMFSLSLVTGPFLALILQPFGLTYVFLASAALAIFALLLSHFRLQETIKERSSSGIKLISVGQILDLGRSLMLPKLGLIYIIKLSVSVVLFMYLFAYQPYIYNTLRGSLQQVTILIIVYGAIMSFTQFFLIKPLVKRIGNSWALICSMALQVLFFVCFSAIGNFYYFLAWAGVFAVANAFYNPISDTLISRLSDERSQGKNLGIGQSYMSLGNILGPLIGGYLIQVAGNYQLPFFLSAPIVLLPLIALCVRQKQYQS